MLAKWAANAPLAFIDQYVRQLRQYRAIAIDVGDQDGLKTDTGKLHDVLTAYGITHDFDIYQGTHTSHVAVRFQDMCCRSSAGRSRSRRIPGHAAG